MKADTVVVEGLEVWYRVGVPPEERVEPQRLELNLEIQPTGGFAAAAAADDLSHTVDYFTLTRRLLAFGAGREWRLIETLAVEIAEWIQREYSVAWVRVEVRKFILAEARYVAVRLERGGSRSAR